MHLFKIGKPLDSATDTVEFERPCYMNLFLKEEI